jgi:hypothetical protein
MRKSNSTILMFCLLFAFSMASAAAPMKPGLWEMTMGSEEIRNMPKPSREEMEQMEQVRRMGIPVPQLKDGAMVLRACVTEEMAGSDEPLQMNMGQDGCQMKNFIKTGNSYSADIVCNGPQRRGQGKVKGTYFGSDRFVSTYDFKGTAGGHPINEHAEQSGKWLSADCGDIKPVVVSPPSSKKK